MRFKALTQEKNYWWILIILLVITFIPFLGEALYNTKGEPREAIVAVSMLQQGNWILPESCGGDIPYKPPFFAWCIATLSSLMGGEVTEFSSRLPSAIAMIVMTMVGFRFYSRRASKFVALVMALITMTAFEVYRAAYACRVDMVLTMFIVTSLYALYHHYERGAKGISWIAILLMSGGVLTKGPIAILLPCLVMGVFYLLRGVGFWRTVAQYVIMGVLACVIPAMWYIAAYQQGGEHFLNLAMEENFGRFLGKMSYESHVNPIHYNFVTVISGMLPYTLLAIFSLFSIKYSSPLHKGEGVKTLFSRFRVWIKKMDDVKLFSLLSLVLIFIFYCIPKSKRSVYLLPIYPFIAYYLTLYIMYLARKGAKSIKVYSWIITSLAIVVVSAIIVIKLGVIPETIFSGKRAAENVAFLHGLENIELSFVNIAMFLSLILVIVLSIKNQRGCLSTGIMAIFTILAIYWNFSAYLQPAVLNTKSDYPVAQLVKDIVPEGEIYSFVDDKYLRFYTINFYTGDRVKLFDKELPESGVVIVGEKDMELLLEKYESKYEFASIFRSDRRSCDRRQPILLLQFFQKGGKQERL
ncbi:MAG: glycosyltransferase family 39 protein [Muribaculaceae bacterium]|nr:glycosyltransferase family 39 protein [Muribaculaceae bacterium]